MTIKITGVVTDQVTQPKNDGSRGSGLYAIPLQLSERPSADWVRLFAATWDRPPSFSTMHRPGIARVTGDKIILDGTTMEELEKHHMETLKLVVHKVNQETDKLEQAARERAEKRQAQQQAHDQQVKDVASRLDFGSGIE